MNLGLRALNRLEAASQRRAASAVPSDTWQFRVFTSCPPDKRLRVIGGRNYCARNRGFSAYDFAEYKCYTVPDLIADLEDPASVLEVPIFSTPYYYQLFFFCLRLPSVEEEPGAEDWTFYLHGTGDEFETSAEAEQWINSETFLEYDLWNGTVGAVYQLCGVVLRNDGQVEIAGAFQPIDVVNRGRSYLWPRDVRPRQPQDA